MNTRQSSAFSNSRCDCRAAISSRAVRVSRLALYQPPTSSSWNRASRALNVSGSRGNFPPSSMPVKPMSRASANTRSSGVSPPSSGMSSLIQAMGLTPKRILTSVSCAFLELIDIGLSCGPHLGAGGDFGDGDVPPSASRFGRVRGVGLYHDDMSPIGELRSSERLFQFHDGRDFFSDRAQARGMRREIDFRRGFEV